MGTWFKILLGHMSPEIEILIYFLDSKKEKTKKIIFTANVVKLNIFEFS